MTTAFGVDQRLLEASLQCNHIVDEIIDEPFANFIDPRLRPGVGPARPSARTASKGSIFLITR